MNTETLLATLVCATVALVGMTGCKPDTSPQGVCDHFTELAKDAGEDTSKAGECVKQLEELQKANAKAYDEFAGCAVAAEDMESGSKCMQKMIAAQLAGK